MLQENEKPLISLRVGSAKISKDLLSPICKMYHLSFSIQKKNAQILCRLWVCLIWK